jgi:hypothetical protein
VSNGIAHLETEGVLYRGDFRLFLPEAIVRVATVEEGTLVVPFKVDVVRLELGTAAEKWLYRIRNPKTLVDKLGVKKSDDVSLTGVRDLNLIKQLRQAANTIYQRRVQSDIIIHGVDTAADLLVFTKLAKVLEPQTVLWIVFPKGVERIKEQQIIAVGKRCGFVSTKVVRISGTHTGLKFVPQRRAEKCGPVATPQC